MLLKQRLRKLFATEFQRVETFARQLISHTQVMFLQINWQIVQVTDNLNPR